MPDLGGSYAARFGRELCRQILTGIMLPDLGESYAVRFQQH